MSATHHPNSRPRIRARPRTHRRAIGAVVALALGIAGLLTTAPAANADPVSVSGVQFRWGFNNESNNRGAAPGTFNFFSAGKLGNPGAGGQTLSNATEGATWANGQPAGWKPSDGNVYIEKLQPDNSYQVATWAGTKTDKDGDSIGPYATSTEFSDHQVVIDNGTGTLDAAADDADLTWDGDFTVIYYSGYTFFYVTDPHLVVNDGVGSVTATLSGYGSDMDDMTQWVTLPPTQVTLATLPDVDVTADGLVTTPAYAGVTYDAPAGATAQVRTGPHWGSFPTSFADFQQLTGQGAYWYSSGGAIDKNKHALPLSVDTSPAPHVTPQPPVVKATPTVGVTSATSTYGRAATVTVNVTAPAGVTATGDLTLTGAGPAQTLPLTGGQATFALPKTLTPQAYALNAAYTGNPELNPAQATKTHTVAKAGAAKPTLKVTKKPTKKKPGKAAVTVKSVVSGVHTSGKATITLKKGKTKKQVAVTLKNSQAIVKLPKLNRGTWKVSIFYAGSTTHTKATSKTYTLKIK